MSSDEKTPWWTFILILLPLIITFGVLFLFVPKGETRPDPEYEVSNPYPW